MSSAKWWPFYLGLNELTVQVLVSCRGGGGALQKNTYELLNLLAVMFSPADAINKNLVPFEIPHQISYPYIERYVF